LLSLVFNARGLMFVGSGNHFNKDVLHSIQGIPSKCLPLVICPPNPVHYRITIHQTCRYY